MKKRLGWGIKKNELAEELHKPVRKKTSLGFGVSMTFGRLTWLT